MVAAARAVAMVVVNEAVWRVLALAGAPAGLASGVLAGLVAAAAVLAEVLLRVRRLPAGEGCDHKHHLQWPLQLRSLRSCRM